MIRKGKKGKYWYVIKKYIKQFKEYQVKEEKHIITSVPWNNEPAPYGFKWNFGEKKWKTIFLEKNIFFSIFEKLFTLNTKPKSAKIRPRIGFSQTKWLYHSALGEILEIKKKWKKKFFRKKICFEWWKIIHPLH